MENEPERGIRCTMCFDMRFERTAARYPDLLYWECNWRKGGGSAPMIEISKRENFYRQEYCGCVYSLCDSNQHRVATGRERIHLGVKFYGVEDGSDTSE